MANKKRLLIWGTMFLAALPVLGVFACKATGVGGNADANGAAIGWTKLNAAPMPENQTDRSTVLELTFDQNVFDLNAEDFTFEPYVKADSLKQPVPGVGLYELRVSEVPKVDYIRVLVTRGSRSFAPAARLWNVKTGESTGASPTDPLPEMPPGDDGITWSVLSSTPPMPVDAEDRTAVLTFVFDRGITGLGAEDFTFSDSGLTVDSFRQIAGESESPAPGRYEMDVSAVPAVESILVGVVKGDIIFKPSVRIWDIVNGTSRPADDGDGNDDGDDDDDDDDDDGDDDGGGGNGDNGGGDDGGGGSAAIAVTGVSLNKPSETIFVGGSTETLTATVEPADATNKTVIWSSSNASAATVSPSGVVTAIANGTATITATTVDGAKTAACTVTVETRVASVSLKSSTTIFVGGTETLTATVEPATATNTAVSWSSNTVSVATVSGGVVTAVANGTAVITVTTSDGSKTAHCSVTVETRVASVSLNTASAIIIAGDTTTLTATVLPLTATNKTVNWSSSNTSVATVSTTGVVTALAAGTAVITATTADGGKTATCTVTVESKPQNNASTIAGSGTEGTVNGTGTGAQFNQPYQLALDSVGNVYVSQWEGLQIRKIASGGVVTTFATIENYLGQLAVDSAGNVYVAEAGSNGVGKVSSTGTVSKFAGTGAEAYREGPTTGTTAAWFHSPTGLAMDSAGTLYIADNYNHRIRKISNGQVSLLAGSSTAAWGDGTGSLAKFNTPWALALDSAGEYLYVADTGNNRIRKVNTSTGAVTTFAGSGAAEWADGTGTGAKFNKPEGIAVDSAGNVYVGDTGNHRIRKISPAGVVTTLAGDGTADFANGTGTAAKFDQPCGIAVDSAGNVYVADFGNNRIRKLSSQ